MISPAHTRERRTAGRRSRSWRSLAATAWVSVQGPASWPRLIAWILPTPVLAFSARAAQAALFMTQEEALSKAFPESDAVERKTAYLTAPQIEAVQNASKTRLESAVVTYYVGRKGGRDMGTAFFDTRTVRTMPMTLMTVIRPDGTVARVDVLAFYEPHDYLPRPRWLDLFRGRFLSGGLRLRRDIPNVTGATLTCQAIADGVRQTAAIYGEVRHTR